MRTFVIIESEIGGSAGQNGRYAVIALEINIFILNRAPQRVPSGRDKNIVQSPPLAVQADLDGGLF